MCTNHQKRAVSNPSLTSPTRPWTMALHPAGGLWQRWTRRCRPIGRRTRASIARRGSSGRHCSARERRKSSNRWDGVGTRVAVTMSTTTMMMMMLLSVPVLVWWQMMTTSTSTPTPQKDLYHRLQISAKIVKRVMTPKVLLILVPMILIMNRTMSKRKRMIR